MLGTATQSRWPIHFGELLSQGWFKAVREHCPFGRNLGMYINFVSSLTMSNVGVGKVTPLVH